MQRGSEKEKSPEEIEAEFPAFKNQLKWTFISDKLIKGNDLEISHQVLRSYMQKEVMKYFKQMKMDSETSWMDGYVDRMMTDKKHVDSSYRRLLTDKLFEWAEGQVQLAEKEITAQELIAMQHDHHH